MTTGTPEPKLRWRRRRGSVAFLLGLTAIAVAVALAFTSPGPEERRVTLTPGFFGATRAVLAQALVAAAGDRGVDAHLVETMRTEDELDRVDAGEVDFALVSGAFRIGERQHAREVAPLNVEALHLMVREDLAGAVA